MDDSPYLEEEDVGLEALYQLFKDAYVRGELDDDGEMLRLHSEAGPVVSLEVDTERRLLKYTAIFGVKDFALEEHKHAFVNAMNDGVILARFCVPRADILMADYYLSYENGLPAYQIVHSLRIFARTVVAAIREYDQMELVD